MPVLFSPRQPGCGPDWFDTPPGRAVLASEADIIGQALRERHGQPWLWLAPQAQQVVDPAGPGIGLLPAEGGWRGGLRCAWPLPVVSQAFGTVVVQHAADWRDGPDAAELLDECARILVDGGRLWLLALNPLTPYRRHWRGRGLAASEPFLWRRRLRAVGLRPEAVSSGVGPSWKVAQASPTQHGAGLRAAFLLRADKRVAAPIPPSPVRALRWQPGLPAG